MTRPATRWPPNLPTGGRARPTPGCFVRKDRCQRQAGLAVGLTLGAAGSFDDRGTVTTVDVPVRGVLAARLELHMPDDGDGGLARVAGERSVDILGGLALLQRMPPG